MHLCKDLISTGLVLFCLYMLYKSQRFALAQKLLEMDRAGKYLRAKEKAKMLATVGIR